MYIYIVCIYIYIVCIYIYIVCIYIYVNMLEYILWLFSIAMQKCRFVDDDELPNVPPGYIQYPEEYIYIYIHIVFLNKNCIYIYMYICNV